MTKFQGWIIIGLLSFISIYLCALRNTMYEIKTVVGDISTQATYTKHYISDISENMPKIKKDISDTLFYIHAIYQFGIGE